MDAVVCGHICIDITPTITGHETVPIDRFFRPGALILVDGIEISPGGAVANTGLALNRLGIETTLIGRTGTDSFAELLSAEVERRGGRAKLSKREGSRTSYSVILTPPGNDRIFLHDPGANNEFSADDVDDGVLANTRVLHFGYPTMMRRIYTDGGAELRSLFRRAHAAGAFVSLDMALPDPDSDVGRVDWHAFLEHVLPEVDLFAPSFEEIAYMVDRPLYRRVREAVGSGDAVDAVTAADLRSLGEKLIAFGAQIAAIKLGRLGLYLRTAAAVSAIEGIDTEEWSAREVFAPSYTLDTVVSGTGAGDVSIAGLLAAILRGESPTRAVRVACAAGAQACRSYDAIGALGRYEEITAAIDDRWPTIETIAVGDAFRSDERSGVLIGPADRGFDA